MDSKKLFHAIVVMGMTAAAACSSGTSEPQQDASADTGSGNDSSTKDVATADTGGGGNDAGGDGFVAWLGC